MPRIHQTVKAAARTVTLSSDPSLVASAVAKGTAFDLRSLKPGMLVDTIVDSVLPNGILVSLSRALRSSGGKDLQVPSDIISMTF